MNISCVICSDLFNPTAEVYTTQCGHMFHYTCLINWLERSKTCPQCRSNTDGVTEDIGTLINKLETVQFQMSLKEKDYQTCKDKYKKAKRQVDALRDEVAQLESTIKVHESATYALKEQVSYFKSKAKETDRLSGEVQRLRNSMKDLENVQLVLDGTREQVNEMLRNERNIESMAILAATLKKSLLDAEKKKRDMEYNLKKSQNDTTRYRREVNTLECQNNELKRDLQNIKDTLEKEKNYLKNRIMELNRQICSENPDVNNSLNRIINESPVNCSRKPKSRLLDDGEGFLNVTESPAMVEKIQKIFDSDSPYLPVKSSNVGIDYTSILNGKTKINASKNGFSIFKPTTKTIESLKPSRSTGDVVYNGLGSSSKDDIFPSPRPAQTGLKRHKSSSVSSTKYRKLAPGVSKVKVTDFFSQSSSQ